MNINMKLALPDSDLRAINVAQGGRGRKATRAEVRIWVYSLVSKTIAALDYVPKPKRAKKTPPAIIEAPVAPDVVCAHCDKPFGEHAGRQHFCPLSKKVRPGARFCAMSPEVLQ